MITQQWRNTPARLTLQGSAQKIMGFKGHHSCGECSRANRLKPRHPQREITLYKGKHCVVLEIKRAIVCRTELRVPLHMKGLKWWPLLLQMKVLSSFTVFIHRKFWVTWVQRIYLLWLHWGDTTKLSGFILDEWSWKWFTFSFYCECCPINFLQHCRPSSRWKSFFGESAALTVCFMSLCNVKLSWYVIQ